VIDKDRVTYWILELSQVAWAAVPVHAAPRDPGPLRMSQRCANTEQRSDEQVNDNRTEIST